MNLGELFHTTFLFLVILDPLGNVPIFVTYLRNTDEQKQRAIIFREVMIALGIMILFLFFGNGFFALLTIKESSLQVAGGVILFLISMRMVFSSPLSHQTGKVAKDPFIVPLAVPAVAGPGILAAISLYGGGVGGSQLTTLFAIIIATLVSLPPLLLAPYLKKILGIKGLIAIERLFGFLIILIAVQMFLEGIEASFLD